MTEKQLEKTKKGEKNDRYYTTTSPGSRRGRTYMSQDEIIKKANEQIDRARRMEAEEERQRASEDLQTVREKLRPAQR
jgi:hypothetical protein